MEEDWRFAKLYKNRIIMKGVTAHFELHQHLDGFAMKPLSPDLDAQNRFRSNSFCWAQIKSDRKSLRPFSDFIYLLQVDEQNY